LKEGHSTVLHRNLSSSPARIPDADPEGITFGPIQVADDGRELRDVGLRVTISHPCTGDLSAWLCYDVDNDGIHDVCSPIEFHLVRLGGYEAPELNAIPMRLEGDYYFKGEVLSGLDGLRKGGSFYLTVADTLGECVGDLQGWAVDLPASVLAASH